MRIAVLGAGPAGLLFSTLWKRRHPGDAVTVFEQNPADATFGFGVVFSQAALDFLREDEPETHALITPMLESWSDITLDHRGEAVVIDGVGFSAIGRLALLRLLQRRAQAVGVDLRFDTAIGALAELGEADLVVGADGVNSLVRRGREAAFGTSLTQLSNRFAWYGVERRFETLTQSFVETQAGAFTAHHYRFTPTMSTFIVECNEATFARAGLAAMDEAESRRLCERAFAGALGGAPLISNRSIWRRFPVLWNETWHVGNHVLIGDALHTAHFSIGSGTRLALEDAIALCHALEAEPGALQAGLARYQAQRKPVVEKIVRAAAASAAWYERFPEHMRLPPQAFAMSYITRSGRLDRERLRAMSPRFVAGYEAEAAA